LRNIFKGLEKDRGKNGLENVDFPGLVALQGEYVF
jgi:hypothetical protein